VVEDLFKVGSLLYAYSVNQNALFFSHLHNAASFQEHLIHNLTEKG